LAVVEVIVRDVKSPADGWTEFPLSVVVLVWPAKSSALDWRPFCDECPLTVNIVVVGLVISLTL
jgi:hypothetical protein